MHPFWLLFGYMYGYMRRQIKRSWDEVSYTIPAQAWAVPLHPDAESVRPIKWDDENRGIWFVFNGEKNYKYGF